MYSNNSQNDWLSNWSFVQRIFSMAGFEKVIQGTIKNDAVIDQIRKFKSKGGISGQSIDRQVVVNLYNQFINNYVNTQQLYKKMSGVRTQYLVNAIIQCLVDDAMAPDPSTGTVLTCKVNNDYLRSTDAQKEINRFVKAVKLDRLISSTIEDAIFYGEYFLENIGDKGTGITKIMDTNIPGTIFAMYDGNHPQYYYRITKDSSLGYNTGMLEDLEPAKVWHISIFPNKLRFSLAPFKDNSAQIEHVMRIGRPLFYATYHKVVELEAFERSQLVREFADIRRTAMVGVSAPEGMDFDRLTTFKDYYEGILNGNPYELNDIQSIDDINQMLEGLSQVRVVPQQPNRGQMTPIDVKNIYHDEVPNMIEDRRKMICQSIGVPDEYVLGQSDEKAGTGIRQHIRYGRLVNQVQLGLSTSIQRLLLVHLQNKGFENLHMDDLDVMFYNNVNVAELDRLEFLDTQVSMLDNFRRFINDFKSDESTKKYVDDEAMVKFMSAQFKGFEGANKILNPNHDSSEEKKPKSKEELHENVSELHMKKWKESLDAGCRIQKCA